MPLHRAAPLRSAAASRSCRRSFQFRRLLPAAPGDRAPPPARAGFVHGPAQRRTRSAGRPYRDRSDSTRASVTAAVPAESPHPAGSTSPTTAAACRGCPVRRISRSCGEGRSAHFLYHFDHAVALVAAHAAEETVRQMFGPRLACPPQNHDKSSGTGS